VRQLVETRDSSSAKAARVAVAEVHCIVVADLGWLFREQLKDDYGIDAQVEIIDRTVGTGLGRRDEHAIDVLRLAGEQVSQYKKILYCSCPAVGRSRNWCAAYRQTRGLGGRDGSLTVTCA
jgi:Domain of unknown function (DUF4365)